MLYLAFMKVICPGHYCVLDNKDKDILENYQIPVEAIIRACPYCHEPLRILNILVENVSYCSPSSEPQGIVAT